MDDATVGFARGPRRGRLGMLNRFLGTVGLDADQWLVCIVVSLAVLVVAEGAKLLRVGSGSVTESSPVPAAA